MVGSFEASEPVIKHRCSRYGRRLCTGKDKDKHLLLERSPAVGVPDDRRLLPVALRDKEAFSVGAVVAEVPLGAIT